MNKIMYVVWYGDNNEKMACFTEEEDAGAFAEQMGGYLNLCKWEVKIDGPCSI